MGIRRRVASGANQLLKGRDRMRLRCIIGFEIEPGAPCPTTSQAGLNPGYGFGTPATIGRNRGAGNRGHRKCLAAKWMREKHCQDATPESAFRRPRCPRSPCYPGASPPYPPRSTSNPRLEVLRGGYGGTSGGVAMAHRVKGSPWPTGEPCQWQRCDMPGDGAVAWL